MVEYQTWFGEVVKLIMKLKKDLYRLIITYNVVPIERFLDELAEVSFSQV